MFCHVTGAKYLGGHRVYLEFNDGVKGEADLHAALQGPVFEPLKSVDSFQRFHLHPEFHTITWENGADFAPEFLREQVLKQQVN